MKKFGILFCTVVASCLGGLVGLPARAEYPEKPVEFVVPFPPGDAEDTLTRLIASEFQNMYGIPAAVVNRPGGGGGPFPGAVSVANAPADGYTIGSFVAGVPVIGPTIGIPELSPNPFEPIGIFLTYPFVIATRGDAPYSSWEKLATYAQENDVMLGHLGSFLLPTQVTFAAALQSGFEFSSEAAFDAMDCNTLTSGDADVVSGPLPMFLPCLDQINVLISVTDAPIPQLSGVPTIARIIPEMKASLWNGLFVRADVPQVARDKIEAAARKAMKSEKALNFMRETGTLVYWEDAEQARTRIASDGKVVEKVNALLNE